MPSPKTASVEAAATRTVVLVGPGGSGKTTVAEAVLLATGAITRLGSVGDGSTVCDHEDVERRMGHSVSLAVASTVASGVDLTGPRWPTVRINLVDTPGHADFVGDLRAGLRAADAALFVVSAAGTDEAGVDGATRMLWQECAAVDMPRAVVLTHGDQPRADLGRAVQRCQAAFGDGVQPLYLPVGEGLVALLSGTIARISEGERVASPASPDELEEVIGARAALIEGIITESEDETLLDRYLGGEQIAFEALVDDLETAVARGAFFPVVPVTPTTGAGVVELVELICRGFPGPGEHVMPAVYTPAGLGKPAPDVDGPLLAEVIKTTTDPYVGRVSLVRVFAGRLIPEAPVHVSGHFARFSGHADDEDRHPEHDLDERVGAISRPLGASLTPVGAAGPGDVIAVARLARAETGDTLSDPAHPAVLTPWSIPEPLLPVAVAAAAASDEDKLMQGLTRVLAEDPTVKLEVNPATEQMVLWCMGEQHLDVLLDRVRARTGVEVTVSAVKVPLRETVGKGAPGLGRHVKQSGGHGQYAVAQIELEPLAPGDGFEFVDEVVGGTVPRQYITSVEKGVRHQLGSGVHGHPMVDIRVRLVGGKAHSVDSSDAAFQLAGSLALKDAAAKAGVVLLEPLDVVAIAVDDEFLGAVMADLAGRRGQVRGTEPDDSAGRSRVLAEVPAAELIRYAADLRSLARGTGTFTREHLRYAPAPAHLTDKLTGKV